jgi:hypothetical protein
LRRGDRAARAAAVVHDDGLPEPVLHELRELAREAVGAAARREGHDEGDRARGVLRLRAEAGEEKQEE